MIDHFFIHLCDIGAPVSIETASNPFGDETVTYGGTMQSIGNKCKFDYRSPTHFRGIEEARREESNPDIPVLFLPAVLQNGYQPRNGDSVVRRDDLDPQFKDQVFIIRTIRTAGLRHHLEADLEIVQAEG